MKLLVSFHLGGGGKRTWPCGAAVRRVNHANARPAPVQKFVSNTGVRIYRIPCQVFDGLSARVYLLLGLPTPTLVDAGSGLGACTRHILAGLETVRREFGERVRASDIGRIIVSHCHMDHIGGLSELVPTAGARVAIHALDRSAVTAHREFTVVGNCRLNGFLRASRHGSTCAVPSC